MPTHEKKTFVQKVADQAGRMLSTLQKPKEHGKALFCFCKGQLSPRATHREVVELMQKVGKVLSDRKNKVPETAPNKERWIGAN